jgi:hypothetical protein
MIRTFYGEGILTEQGAENLKHYKYSGGDESLIYKYITGKLAQMLVDHVFPVTLA